MSTRKIFSAIMMAFVVALLILPTYSASAAEQLVGDAIIQTIHGLTG